LRDLAVRNAAQVHAYTQPTTQYLWLNTQIQPFDRVLARRAVNYAVDRSRLVQLYGGRFLARATCQALPPDLPGYAPYCPYAQTASAGTYSGPDLTEARHLVARSGTRGATVTVLVRDSNSSDVPAGRYLVSVLDSLGYRARLKSFPAGAHDQMSAAVTSGRFQSGINGWVADYPAPSDFIDVWFSCGSPLRGGEARFCDPDVQGLIDRAIQAQTYDPASAPELWASADRAIVDAAPWVPFVTPLSVNFVSSRVGNYQDSQPYSGVLLDQLWVR